jgi:hypothetical protein
VHTDARRRGAAWVRVTLDGRAPVELETLEGPPGESADFYVIAVPPQTSGGRVNRVDSDGNEGSPGVGLLPP